MKLDRLIYGFSLVGLLGFYSCSSEDGLMQNNPVKGEQMPLTITVNRGEAGTRTILSENKANGGLTSKWEDGDQLHVYSSTGKDLGTLTIQSGQETSVGVFSGTIDKVTDGQFVSLFYYNLIEGMVSVEEASIGNYLKIDVSEQEFKSVSALSKLDILTSANPNYEDTSDEATVQLSVSADNSVTVKRDVTLQSKLAFARFSMKNLPTGAKGTLYITDVNDKLYVSHGLNFNSCERTQENTSPNGIKITNVEAGEDVYVALIPSYNSAVPNYTLKFKFVNDKDNKVYTYQFTKPTKIEAGKYYNTFTEGADGQDGTIDGFAINFSEDQSGSDPDYPGYENEDPRNPLHKFAKFNLVRVGDRGSLVNDFADSETENGALYQWGRNYGYMDTNGIYNTDIVDENEDFTNFIDALGRFDDADAEYERTLDYFVYNPRPTGRNSYFMTSGTAMRYTPQHPQYSLWYDSPNFYSTKEELQAHPDKYFMDGTPGTRYYGYGNLAIGMEQKNEKPDYWLSSFGDGGSTWEQRAKNCGYTSTNPCPDGWRMPTLEEFQAIAPEGQGLDAKKNMATMLSNYAESRTTKDGVNYVIRWIFDESAITIEAVVTESKLAKSEINSSFWDNNRDKKVVRVFPFTGSIVPLICLSDGDYMANIEYVVRPHHRGFLDYTGFPGGYGNYSNNYYWMLIGPGNNGGAPFGGYWIDEKNYAFKFEAKEISHGINTSNSIFTTTSCLFVGSAEPVMGYAIRPVMDK